jgi:adenosine deaminase
MRAETGIPGTTIDDSSKFIFALESGDIEALKKIPKADLHSHGTLGMRYSTLKRILGSDAPPPPPALSGLPGFFSWTSTAIRPFARQRRYAEALISATIEDAIDDGVRVLETSFDLGVARGFPDAESYGRFAAYLRDRYANDIRIKPEIGFKKDANLRADGPLIQGLIGTGAFESIDLYGPEVHPLLLGTWTGIYSSARKAGLKLKAHFGEFEGPFGLPFAAKRLGVSAFQHGIGLAKSRRALAWAVEAGIVCNVCPASNIALGAASSLKGHPIRAMFDAGLKITIATDDLVAFGSSVSEQFMDLHRAGIFEAGELDRIRLMGLDEGKRRGP